MTIKSRDFGLIEADEARVLKFPDGLFGFEEYKSYALLSPLGESTFPMWLQSVDSEGLCFIVFDPTIVQANYKVTLTASEEKLLKITGETDLTALVLARVPEDYRQSTVNLKSPVVINADERIAAQVILPDDYPFRHPLYLDLGGEG